MTLHTLKKKNYVVVAGGAAHIKELAGAMMGFQEKREVLGCAGTSAGALVAASTAFAISKDTVERTLLSVLQDNALLDFSPLAWFKYGICSWEVMKDVIEDVWGSDARLGDANIPLAVIVSDLETRKPRTFSSWETPHVRLAETLAASSAIPFLVAAQTIPSAGTITGNSKRLFCDGGIADNFALDTFADKEEPTVGLCLYGQVDSTPKPIKSLTDYIASVASLALWESADISARRDDRVIALKSNGGGFDFDQTPAQIKEGIEHGKIQVLEALSPLPSKK